MHYAPNPIGRGHCIPTRRISQKRCVLGIKLLQNTNRKRYKIYRMVSSICSLLAAAAGVSWPWVTFDPDFKVTTFLRYWISQKRHEIAIVTTERQQEVVCALFSLSLSVLTAISRWIWFSRCILKQRMMEVVMTTGAINHAKLQSNHHR